MKRASMKLNFEDYTISINSENIPLISANSGNYAIPITKAKNFVNNLDRENNMNITLRVAENNKGNQYIAPKLHKQFAHPSERTFLQLIHNTCQPWQNDENLKEEIKNVSRNCATCKLFKEPPPRPIVGLRTAAVFQETVAMDLKFYNAKILFHPLDHSARLSASTFIPYKNYETIIKFFFKIWISVYGTLEKFMTENGGVFANT